MGQKDPKYHFILFAITTGTKHKSKSERGGGGGATFSNIVCLGSRLMRLRKLYEIGGAYRATILTKMPQ